MTLVILACALESYNSWWPFFVVLFYVFSVFPSIAHRRFEQGSFSGTSPCLELSIFITMGLVVSSFGLPIVLARAATIKYGAAYLTLAGNVVVYSTIFVFYLLSEDDNSYLGSFP